jgi:hypothetical protein
MPAGNGRGASYSDEEVNDFLCLMLEIAPIGPYEWEQVVEEHKEKYEHLNRDKESIRRKYKSLANQWIPTGDPNCPPLVYLAKKVQREIKRKSDCGDMESEDTNNNLIVKEDGDYEGEERPNIVVAADPPLAQDFDDEAEREEDEEDDAEDATTMNAVCNGVTNNNNNNGTGAMNNNGSTNNGATGRRGTGTANGVYNTLIY